MSLSQLAPFLFQSTNFSIGSDFTSSSLSGLFQNDFLQNHSSPCLTIFLLANLDIKYYLHASSLSFIMHWLFDPLVYKGRFCYTFVVNLPSQYQRDCFEEFLCATIDASFQLKAIYSLLLQDLSLPR